MVKNTAKYDLVKIMLAQERGKYPQCAATVLSAGRRCKNLAKRYGSPFCTHHRYAQKRNVPNVPRNTPWERQRSKRSQITLPEPPPTGETWERGNVEEGVTVPGCSQTDDQPRHGSTAEPCRAWEGSSRRAGEWE